MGVAAAVMQVSSCSISPSVKAEGTMKMLRTTCIRTFGHITMMVVPSIGSAVVCFGVCIVNYLVRAITSVSLLLSEWC